VLHALFNSVFFIWLPEHSVKDKKLYNLCLNLYTERERERGSKWSLYTEGEREAASGVYIVNVVENGFLYSRRKQKLNIKFLNKICCFVFFYSQEKFKREFQQRFPFRSRGRSAHHSHTIDSDFDKSQTLQTRVSVRLSYYSNSYDWRRSYSARAQQHAALLPQNNSFYHGVSVRGPIRSHNTSNNGGVTTELYLSSGKQHDNDNGSDMDELCL